MEVLLAIFVVLMLLLGIANVIVLIGLANFMIRFSDNFKKFLADHQEFQQDYYDFMAEVRGKKGLVEIVNRVMPRP
jgi:hypothetical protein